MQKADILGKLKQLNPFILIIVFILFVIFILVSLLSILKFPVNQNGKKIIASPSAPREIPQNETIPTPDLQPPASVSTNKYGEVSFIDTQSSFPDSLPIYKTSPTQVAPSTAAVAAKNLGFDGIANIQDTKQGKALFWQNDTESIIFYIEIGNIQYFGPSKNTARINSPSDAAVAAQTFFLKLNPLGLKMTPDLNSSSYILSESVTDSFEKATSIDVPFVQKINNLTIYSQFGNNSDAHIIITKDGLVDKAFINTPPTLNESRTQKILTLEAAKQAIANGYGTFVTYGTSDDINLSIPDKTIISNISLGYFRDNKNNTLYPIYVFSGTSHAQGLTKNAVIYLPAAK